MDPREKETDTSEIDITALKSQFTKQLDAFANALATIFLSKDFETQKTLQLLNAASIRYRSPSETSFSTKGVITDLYQNLLTYSGIQQDIQLRKLPIDTNMCGQIKNSIPIFKKHMDTLSAINLAKIKDETKRVKAEECRQNILELSGKAEKLLSTSTLLAGEPKETENKFPGWRTTLRAVTPPKEKAPSEQEKPHDFGVRLRKTGRNLTR